MSEFDKLLAELDELSLAKSQTGQMEMFGKADKPSAQKGDEDEDDDDAWDKFAEDEDEDDDDEDENEKPMGKSFSVTLPGGEEVEALDGTLLVKALRDDLLSSQGEVRTSLNQIGEVLQRTTAMLKSLAGDNAALRAEMDALASAGRGRKSALSVHEKPATTVAPTQVVPSRKEILAKAMDAMNAGRISGYEVALAEGCLNRGQALPEALAARIG